MRTLKFRVWDKNIKDVYYNFSNKHDFTYFTFKNDVIVQQFTGKLDKNNKELYEGDIIKYSIKVCDLGEPETGIGEVYYDEDSCCFLFDKYYEWDFIRSSLYFEIVGNIFETPELLK